MLKNCGFPVYEVEFFNIEHALDAMRKNRMMIRKNVIELEMFEEKPIGAPPIGTGPMDGSIRGPSHMGPQLHIPHMMHGPGHMNGPPIGQHGPPHMGPMHPGDHYINHGPFQRPPFLMEQQPQPFMNYGPPPMPRTMFPDPMPHQNYIPGPAPMPIDIQGPRPLWGPQSTGPPIQLPVNFDVRGIDYKAKGILSFNTENKSCIINIQYISFR